MKNNRIKAILAGGLPVLLLAVLNLIFTRLLFTGEYTAVMPSIESQYLAYVKFILESFPHIIWHPFWYFGFPFYLVYQPIVPFSIALASFVSGVNPGGIYRISIGIAYTLGSISCFFLAKELIKKNLPAFFAALLYSAIPLGTLLISPIAQFMQGFNFLPWRLLVLIYFGEGAHTWGIAVLPIALLCFKKLLETGQKNWFFSSVMTFLFILLTSSTAFMPLVIMVLVLLMLEMARGAGSHTLKQAFAVALFVLGLGLFWYNPSFLEAAIGFAQEGGIVRGMYRNPVFIIFVIFPALVTIYFSLKYLIQKNVRSFPFVLTAIWSLLFFFLIFLQYRYDFSLLPLPHDYLQRFGPELDLSSALFLASLLATECDLGINKYLRIAFWGVLFFLVGIFILPRIDNFSNLAKPNSDISQSSEYRVARWLEEHSARTRVYATGTHSQWLNVFTNVPQLRGVKGGDFGGLNPWWAHISYQLLKGADGKLALNWLQALGIKYIVVNTADSRVYFKDYTYPGKYSWLRNVYEYEGDIIYEVPSTNTSLALALEPGWAKTFSQPDNLKSGKIVLDKERLEKYLGRVESAESLRINYPLGNNWSQMTVFAPDNPHDLLVRISYQPGWSAFDKSGKQLEIESDPIGFINIHNAAAEIKLSFSPTTDVLISFLVSILSAIFFVYYLRHAFNYNHSGI